MFLQCERRELILKENSQCERSEPILRVREAHMKGSHCLLRKQCGAPLYYYLFSIYVLAKEGKRCIIHA